MNLKPDLDLNTEPADALARILIVDDDLHNRTLLEVMLGPEGFLLLSAANGEDALALVEKSPPDLILLDVMMPGMSGYQVASKIKSNPATSNIPIIMVTALDDQNSRMLGLNAGAEEFLSKPVDRAELCVRVRNLLRLKAYSDYHDQYGKMLEGEVDSRAADLVESERLYRSTFDAAPVGIVHAGLDGRWLRFNQCLCDLLGYSQSELQSLIDQNVSLSNEEVDEIDAYQQMALGTLQRYVVDEKRFQKQNGQMIWTRVNTSVYTNSEGDPQHLIFIIEDITDRKKFEEDIRLAGRMESIGSLAAGVAHELSNPLAYLIANLEFIAKELRTSLGGRAPTDPVRELTDGVDDAREGAERIRLIVRGLKRFARADDERRLPLEILPALALAVNMTMPQIQRHARLFQDLGPIPYVEGNEARLSQVFFSLLLNAANSIGEGQAPEDNEIRILTSTDELGRAVVVFRDTGSGIPAEIRDRIFDPFYATKPMGVGKGLSLAICHGIVAAYGGELSFESQLGVGTTFRVVLPAARPEAIAAADRPVASSIAEAPGRRGKILVIEDDPMMARALNRILSPDHDVVSAANGREAMERFVQGERFDVIISDLFMPVMSGMQLHDWLLQTIANQAHKIIFITGGSFTRATQEFLDRVPNQRIEKPLDAMNIRNLVQNFVR